MKMLDLSIIIVNWNTIGELRDCLLSVEQEALDKIETIVVDNGSSDGSAGMVRKDFPWAQMIRNEENLGFSRANNQGIAASRGRYVLLLNSDCLVQKGALQGLVDFADENPDSGLFGPKILNLDGTIYFSCRRFPTLRAGIFRNTILGKYFPKNAYTRDYLMVEWDHSEPRDVDWLSGAALLIRRKLLDEIGVLDERFYMYCEDVDIAYRAKKNGWRAVYYPYVAIVHARARSSDKVANRMIIEFHKSMYRFFKKHYSRNSSIFVKLLVPVGLFARASFFIVRNWRNHLRSKLTHRKVNTRDET